ncbi:hypothetical protein NB640_08380 [Oxalobacter vibrioformis]|uniref:Uncharacterized protein n=1 Tax=Oxalobacter vibrioformis TaxID=933080 RepID=A0A9E9LX93_9BURK|nr:hypothetical protein [Oxalobacter vibrioformis]WAW09280.1 hypothetical protein NB640_08380 [Oxalobacter vibrioformis]
MNQPKSGETQSVKDLRATIEWIDGLSQESTAKIMAIANLALLAMETPSFHLESLAQAFKAIADLAFSLEECIGYHANTAGCNSTCQRSIRRHQAYIAMKEAQS